VQIHAISEFLENALKMTQRNLYWGERALTPADVADPKGILPVVVNQSQYTAGIMAELHAPAADEARGEAPPNRSPAVSESLRNVTIEHDDDGTSLLGYQVRLSSPLAYPLCVLLLDSIDVAVRHSADGVIDLSVIDPPMPPEILSEINQQRPAVSPGRGPIEAVAEADTPQEHDAGTSD